MMRRCFFMLVFLVGLIILGADVVSGQGFPNKTIRIVASEAGGAGDMSARLIAQALSGSLGQQVIVDNRGGGVVAGEVVYKAPPDGHTMLIYANSFWLMPLMRSYVPYDPVKDFTPVIMVATSPNVLVVHPKVPANSVKELIALAKAKPGQLNYGSAATGTSNHLAAELFKSMTGTDIMRIPFKGMASALTALVAGEVQLMFSVATNAMSQVKSGRLRALAVTSSGPSAITPGLPTVAASGVPGYKSSATYVLFAPAGTPAPIIKRLNQEIARVLNRADVKERFFKAGLETIGSSPEEARDAIQSELVTMGKVIKDANIRDE
jgi:tripartite-type tricarboxylate transporter receptor subunit TctC